MSKKNQKPQYYVLIPLLISFPIASFAELQVTPTLELSEIYTDNVTPEPSGPGDFITRIAPGFNLRARGSSTTLDMIYQLEHLIYAKDRNRDATYQQFQANMNSALIQDMFFIDVDASKFQSVIDSQSPVFSNIQITENRTDVETLGVSPYLQFPVFSFAQSELRYRYQLLNYDDAAVTDSETQQLNFVVRSNERSRQFAWRLDYDKREIDFEASTTSDFINEDVFLELSYRTNPSFALVGLVGYEDIEYVDRAALNISDSYWELGFIWDLTRRTILELRTGDRYDDTTYFGRFASRTRYSNWQLAYSEDLMIAADEQVERDPFQPNQGTASLTAEPFLEKRLEFNYIYSKGGNGVSINAYNLKRNFQVTPALEKTHGGEASIDWRVYPGLTLSLLGAYQSETIELTNGKVISREIGLRATRRISSTASGYLAYRHVEFEDVPTSVTRQENILEATLELTF